MKAINGKSVLDHLVERIGNPYKFGRPFGKVNIDIHRTRKKEPSTVLSVLAVITIFYLSVFKVPIDGEVFWERNRGREKKGYNAGTNCIGCDL